METARPMLSDSREGRTATRTQIAPLTARCHEVAIFCKNSGSLAMFAPTLRVPKAVSVTAVTAVAVDLSQYGWSGVLGRQP